ncbi:hypothetical protein ALC56_03651, partial [Trachymyrmex septentrionalis]
NLETEILVCQICKKRGHSDDKCRLRDPRSARPVNALQSNVIFCQLCSKPGHNAKMYRNNNNVPFLSPKAIIASPRSESLFYVRVENPEIKIGYIPKIKLAHGIYLGDTIVESVSGKTYLNIISTLDEEVKVQVPTLRLKPLDELFDNHKLTIETQDDRTKITDIQVDFSGLNHQEQEGFRTFLVNSTPLGCEEGSNQSSLRNATQFNFEESKGKDFLILPEEIKFSRVGTSMSNNNQTSRVINEELAKITKLYDQDVRSSYSYEKESKPSSKIPASTQV